MMSSVFLTAFTYRLLHCSTSLRSWPCGDHLIGPNMCWRQSCLSVRSLAKSLLLWIIALLLLWPGCTIGGQQHACITWLTCKLIGLVLHCSVPYKELCADELWFGWLAFIETSFDMVDRLLQRGLAEHMLRLILLFGALSYTSMHG